MMGQELEWSNPQVKYGKLSEMPKISSLYHTLKESPVASKTHCLEYSVFGMNFLWFIRLVLSHSNVEIYVVCIVLISSNVQHVLVQCGNKPFMG